MRIRARVRRPAGERPGHGGALAMLLAVALGGCAGGTDAPATASSAAAASAGTGGRSGAQDAATPAPPVFSTTDTAWLQLTVAMDERALAVLDLVHDRAADPAVVHLAAELTADHRDLLSRLRARLDVAGRPKANPHEGHDMPGMATAAQLAALGQASGAGFLRLFAEAMRAHLAQAVRLARAEQKSGTDPATKAIAVAIEKTRTTQQAQLERLL